MKKQPTLVRFGPFEMRPRTRELFKGKTKLKLRPQPFQILEILLEHPGELVTREELRAKVWLAGTHVDFEHGLNASIKELRGVLSDSASKPRYVETLPKLGYRMIAPVAVEETVWDKGGYEGHESRTEEERVDCSSEAYETLGDAGWHFRDPGYGCGWVCAMVADKRAPTSL